MTFTRPRPPALRDPTPRLLSACLWHWDAAGASIDAESGHAGTFVRATTLASVADGAGSTYTAPHSMPAWEIRDVDGAPACGLRMAGSDRLTWDPAPPVQAMAGLLEMIETGARTTANETLFALSNDGPTGARLWIDTNGTRYGLNWTDGTTTRTARLGAGNPVSGDHVLFTWQLAADGAITFRQSINGAAATTASAVALTLPSAWGSGALVRLNARGDAENIAQGWYRRAKLVAGTPDLDVLAAIR